MLSPNSESSCGYGDVGVRESDIERAKENKERYGYLYDAWDDESPASINQQMSRELRDKLKGGDWKN